MPVWHEATRKLREEGKIRVVGIIQEQHPDRCRLFMQWQQMDWLILVDALNLLEVSVVPVVLLVDEHGVVRTVMRNPSQIAEALVSIATPRTVQQRDPASNADAPFVRAMARVRDAVYFDKPPRYAEALHVLDEALADQPENGLLHFARGVVFRARYDSPQRQDGDFQGAVDAWQAALDIDPNQYIWRRRIQQYGPRLIKPYPFYDWVEQARHDIGARGDTPIALSVEPAGSELAGQSKEFTQAEAVTPAPDRDARIARDNALITVEVTVVPPRIRPGETARVHVALRPNKKASGHWNNEAEPLQVRVDVPNRWSAEPVHQSIPNAPLAVSEETRALEFEVAAPTDAPAGSTPIPAYALYNVCTGPTGACLYRRQDFNVQIKIIGPQP